MDIERVKKVIANTVVIAIILFFGLIMFIEDINPTVLQGGDIQHAIDMGQDK